MMWPKLKTPLQATAAVISCARHNYSRGCFHNQTLTTQTTTPLGSQTTTTSSDPAIPTKLLRHILLARWVSTHAPPWRATTGSPASTRNATRTVYNATKNTLNLSRRKIGDVVVSADALHENCSADACDVVPLRVDQLSMVPFLGRATPNSDLTTN